MTNFLELNNMAVPVAIARPPDRMRYRHGAYSGRGFDGTARHHHRTTKRVWSFETPRLAEATAEELEGLLTGLGERFSFDASLYSDGKGFPPDTGYSGCTIDSGTKKIGAAALKITSGNSATFSFGITGDMTVMLWHTHGTWNHWAAVYDSNAASWSIYQNNTAPTDAMAFATLVGGTGNLTLHGKNDTGTDLAGDGGNANAWYDEMLILPYQATSAQRTAHHNSGTGYAFGSLPKLKMAGDVLLETGPIDVIPVFKGSRQVYGVDSGSFSVLMRELRFELHEV